MKWTKKELIALQEVTFDEDIEFDKEALKNNQLLLDVKDLHLEGDGYFNDNEYITSFITLTSGKFEAPIKRLKNPAIITIKGSSMEPTFKEGNMILVDAGNKDFIEGKVYVIRIGDNLCIKRLFKNPLNNKIICKPDNPLHPTLELTKDEFEIKAIFVLKIFEEIV